MPQKFGGKHTEQKLSALEKYLDRYTTALKKTDLRLIYFDAFAGTGDIDISKQKVPLFQGDDYGAFIDGSVRRALKFGERFAKYIFVESKRQNARKLDELVAQHPAIRDRIEVITGDANPELMKFCKGERGGWRAVVFLDPYGNQVDWTTIAALGRTEAVDLWYLFPAGLGVARQLGNDGNVHYTHGTSLDRIFGTANWRNAFLEEKREPDLFQAERSSIQKVATTKSITRYMIERMKTEFRGGVLEDWLPLGSNGIHMYSLLFACANPRGTAAEIALRLAAGVLRSERRGRS